jgi:hypothetical protein
MSPLVLKQQLIGFDRFFEGEFHSDWAIHQNNYYASFKSKQTGNSWCTKVIVRLWDIRYRFWESRNDKEHKNDNIKLQQKLNMDIENEILQGFNDFSVRYNKQITAAYIEKILQSTNAELKRSWLRNIQAARQITAIIPPTPIPIARILDTSQKLVTRYFNPAPTSTVRA